MRYTAKKLKPRDFQTNILHTLCGKQNASLETKIK